MVRSLKPHSANLRKGRFSQSGHYYFLTTSIHQRRPIFLSPPRAQIVLDAIRWLDTKRRFNVDAAVVMPDHLHLVGQLCDTSLPSLMHSLKSYSANRLATQGVQAPVWQDGYHDHGLRRDEDYVNSVRYVLENPLRAGLADAVEDYPFTILPDWWQSPC